MIPLKKLVPTGSARVFGKYEAGNPSSSLKDRPALALIEKHVHDGRLNRGAIIVAATSGNTGLSLAMISAVRCYKLHLFMPKDASLEKRDLFGHFGAVVHLTPENEGVSGARRAALDFAALHQKALFLDQFGDKTVVDAHVTGTAKEILTDFPEGVDAFVMGVGTGGTISGVGQVLKARFPKTLIVAVEPKASAVLSGGDAGHSKIQQLGLGFVPENLRRDLIDRVIQITDDEAYQMTQRLAREEGLLLGLSSGAIVSASLQVAAELGVGKTVLTVFCDQGQRYFSLKKFFKK